MRLAFVVQRYGDRITGGAEQLCRQVAENLSERHRIDILTTTAKDYTDWRNYYIPGNERIERLTIRRFPIEGRYNASRFRWRTRFLFRLPHTLEDERRWIEAQGPFTPALVEYIERHRDEYDLIFFFSYRYYPSFFGLPKAASRSVLVPTAEHDRTIYLESYQDLFRSPRGIIYLTPEERQLIQGVADNGEVEHRVIGIGISHSQEPKGERFRREFGIQTPYLLYVGRIDENKGCGEMFDHMWRYFDEHPDSPLRLLLIGFRAMKIKPHPRIIHIGYLDDADKFDAIDGAEAMIMPSRYESLSIVTLEGMSTGTPVLVNGRCEVLAGHAERSGGALAYHSYEDFKQGVARLTADRSGERQRFGDAGREYIAKNYTWPIITGQYEEWVEGLVEAGSKLTGAGSQ